MVRLLDEKKKIRFNVLFARFGRAFFTFSSHFTFSRKTIIPARQYYKSIYCINEEGKISGGGRGVETKTKLLQTNIRNN